MKASITIPYNTALSKNWYWRHNRGRTHISVNGKAERDAIAIEIKRKCPGHQWAKAKIWAKIMVYRPDMRADPCNFIDGILDGIKIGTGIDDRYYSGSWDWELDKENPRIVITVSQQENSE